MDRLDSSERNWRYLFEPASRPGAFSKLFEDLGVSLPRGVSLQDVVRFGWVRPLLRIRIPDDFYLAWKSYPVMQWDEAPNLEEFGWVFRLYAISDANFRFGGWSGGSPPPDWYQHPLDSRADPQIVEILEHRVDPGEEAPAVEHPTGLKILPWIDLFAYWQVYHLAEVLRATPLFKPILNVPNAPTQIRWMADHYESLKSYSDSWIAALARKWGEHATLFGWISQYRTVLGYWVASGLSADAVELAAKDLALAAGLTPDRIKEDVRERLLVVWKDWDWQHRDAPMVTGVSELLRQDILRAVEFLVAITGSPLDPEDPFFEPPDLQPRAWSRLSEALPFENQSANRGFLLRAPFYVKGLNQFLPAAAKLTDERIKAIVYGALPTSANLQRFCVSFERLHEQFGAGTSSTARLDLRTASPVDFLLLCALSTEKLLLERYLVSHSAASGAPDFSELVNDAADTIGSRLGVATLSTSIPWKLTNLRGLPIQRQNPFSTGKGLPKGSLSECLTAVLFDFVVMRNYAAHHDCLDDELIYKAWGKDPLEAVVAIVLLVLI